jgi:dsDNA-specific endonuclease/ATPase MutS2
MNNSVKRCTKCGIEKPLKEFTKRKDSKDGFNHICINCKKDYYYSNIERVKERTKEYYANNKEKMNKATKKWQKANKAKVDKRAKEWKRQNPDKCKKVSKKYRDANRDIMLERTREWKKENPDKIKAWVEKNRAIVTQYSRTRRARKLKAKGTFTANQFKNKQERQKNKCWWCTEELEGKKVHADHVIPLSKGGTNDISNIVASCASCNFKKNAKMPHEFAGRLF